LNPGKNLKILSFLLLPVSLSFIPFWKKMKKKMFAGALPQVFENAKRLRKNMTDAEQVLWFYLKQHPGGCKFRRQHPIWMYIADFYCHQRKLVIELDGSIHSLYTIQERDRYREKLMKEMNLKVVRFTNKEVMENVLLVMQKIEKYLNDENHSSLQGGKEGLI
jgi:imidazole glycerol-phosphate synthase subunit HisF